MARSPREIVRDVLPPAMARALWSGNYREALPVSVQDFALSAALPAVFYMFRFGQRRGRGRFLEEFGGAGTPAARRRAATVERVAARLAGRDDISGFDSEAGRAILGDLLLCYGLENKRYALGRDRQVQRVAPVHYLSSWVDLPEPIVNLRFVPEMIVAMLANQKQDGSIEATPDEARTWFPVARRPGENPLLQAFAQAVTWQGNIADRAADGFDETDHCIGIDQLAIIRVAQELGRAPDKLRGGEGARIPNQQPIARRAAEEFSGDIRRFVRSYASVIPRRSFVDLLESCMAVGMTTILTSVAEMLFHWEAEGTLPGRNEQQPVGILVDCSNGVSHELRRLSEDSLDDFFRRLEQLPRLLMLLRLLDHEARHNRLIRKKKIETRPYATEWIEMLGALFHERHPEADFIHRTVEGRAEELSAALEKEGYSEAATILQAERSQPNAVGRFAAGLTALMGTGLRKDCSRMADSMICIDRPTGLARGRRVERGGASGAGPKTRVARSLVLTDSVLEYLVHGSLLRSGGKPGVRRLSFGHFLRSIRRRYGFCVDSAPRGAAASNDLLQANRAFLERRLRDLGLLRGVNDAEAMKRLQPRFSARSGAP